MKKTTKKRGSSRQKAYEGSRLMGTGSARKAAKAIKKTQSTKRSRLNSIMGEIRATRGKKK